MFLLARDGFLNYSPLKSFVVCQLDMVTFVISLTMCSISFFSVNRGEPKFCFFFGRRTQKTREQFSGAWGSKLG